MSLDENTKPKKGYTAPKGRPTVHNTGAPAPRRLSPVMEWTLAIIVFVVVLGAVFYFGRDFRSGGAGGGGHSGAPASVDTIDALTAALRASI